MHRMNSSISKQRRKDELNISNSDEKISYALLRAVAGTNLLMHGFSRLLAGPQNFAAHLTEQFARSPLPEAMVRGFGAALPPIEGADGSLAADRHGRRVGR